MSLLMPLVMSIVISSNHPITLILALMFTTTLLAYKTYLITKMSLLSYTIMLVILGGLIILFIYMASLAPNESFSSKKNWEIIIVTLPLTYLMLTKSSSNIPMEFNTTKIFTLLMNPLWMVLAMTYLLFTLIAVVKITSMSQGPLRANW